MYSKKNGPFKDIRKKKKKIREKKTIMKMKYVVNLVIVVIRHENPFLVTVNNYITTVHILPSVHTFLQLYEKKKIIIIIIIIINKYSTKILNHTLRPL